MFIAALPLSRDYTGLLQVTCMVWTILFVSSRAAIAVEVPKEAAPLWNPLTMRPSFRYCSIGNQTKSLRPCTRTTVNIQKLIGMLEYRRWRQILLASIYTRCLEQTRYFPQIHRVGKYIGRCRRWVRRVVGMRT